jgi:hypothetical protein
LLHITPSIELSNEIIKFDGVDYCEVIIFGGTYAIAKGKMQSISLNIKSRL